MQAVLCRRVCLLQNMCPPRALRRRNPATPHPPHSVAIMNMSVVIKQREGREGKREAVGGETTGQAFDEFSLIDMLRSGDLAEELKCQRTLSRCSCREKVGG